MGLKWDVFFLFSHFPFLVQFMLVIMLLLIIIAIFGIRIKKLGHPNSVILTHLMKHGYLSNTNGFSSLSFDCVPCKLEKSKSLPFPLQSSRGRCFEIIHSNVWGMSHVISHTQYMYFVTFIDDYSRFTWVYFLRSKANVFPTFQNFVAYVKTQFSTCIKILRSDSRGECISHAFQYFL
jgi:hypothetical protein